jgi:hypothetical protein
MVPVRVARVRRSAALLVAAAMVAALVCCSPEARTARPGARRQPLDLGAGAPSRARTPIPLSVGPLAGGTYTSTVFSPQLTLTVGEGWKLRFESSRFLNLRRADQEELDFVVEAEASVLDPPAFSDAEGESEVQERLRPMPHDYIEYLRGLPYLDVGVPQPVSLSGSTGRAVDYVVTQVPSLPGNCLGQPGACFVPFAISSVDLALLLPGARVHVVNVDVGNHSVIIMATSASPAALAAMTAVIPTVQFG